MYFKNIGNYKDTLTLPISDFPIEAIFSKREPLWIKEWMISVV